MKRFEINGKILNLRELSEINGIDASTIRYRLKRGVTLGDAIKATYTQKCVLCGATFESKRTYAMFCSNNCKHRYYKGKGVIKPEWSELKTFVCDCCGQSFQSYNPNARLCSEKCRHAVARLERRKHFRDLKKCGKFDASVTLENVYNKFNQKCCICNKPLHFGKNPLLDDYPTIDHIQPLSKGGSHTWDNVQLMCRKCNIEKGANWSD